MTKTLFQVDKSPAAVVWDRDDYLNEAEKQLEYLWGGHRTSFSENLFFRLSFATFGPESKILHKRHYWFLEGSTDLSDDAILCTADVVCSNIPHEKGLFALSKRLGLGLRFCGSSEEQYFYF